VVEERFLAALGMTSGMRRELGIGQGMRGTLHGVAVILRAATGTKRSTPSQER
jgi:hypothetical protein